MTVGYEFVINPTQTPRRTYAGLSRHARFASAKEQFVQQLKGEDVDPNPDYDASDEVEYFFNWLPWALRGVYPPPAYPPA